MFLDFPWPTEIKTYHHTTYDRISPLQTFDGTGKTVLITAGATGIGFGITQSFAKAGVEYVIIIQRRQKVLDKVRESLATDFPSLKVTTRAASVTDFERISSILKEIGKIDVLVANAGIGPGEMAAKDMPTEVFRDTFNLNVVSSWHLIKEFLALEPGKPRTVIYTSSARCQTGSANDSAYGPSKAAMNQVIQHLAMEYADDNAVIQTFHPGVVYTPWASQLFDRDVVVWEDASLPGDFAVWLASAEAKFLSGRYVWAQWDVDELLSLKERLTANPQFLMTTVMV
ncbi:hypothetical protein MBLNU230_g6645t1 [Neophaeotheca triangularis]